MRGITLIATGVFALGAFALDVSPASAQANYYSPRSEAERAQERRAVRAPARIRVTPDRQLVRVCEDWLAVERRPSGDVITPQMRCRWGYR